MAAPDLESLLNFEGNFEKAMQGALTTSGVISFMSSAASKLPLHYTGIAADCGASLEELEQIPKPSTWPANTAAPQEYVGFPLNLELTVEVPRDDQGTVNPNVDNALQEVRSKVRAVMLRSCAPFNPSNLPYYVVSNIKPAGSLLAYNRDRNVDFCTLRYVVTFRIRPDAWPAWDVSKP